MSIFEDTRRALITLLRADKLVFEPPPKVLVRGIIGRNIERVHIHAIGVPIENTDVKLDELRIEAHNVRLALSRRGPVLRVGSGYFQARITQEQLSELVPLPMGVDRLSVTPRGLTFHTVAGIPIYTSVTLEDHKLVVSPSAPTKVPLLDLIGIDIDMPQLPVSGGLEQLTRFGLTFPLPRFPGNAVIDELELESGSVFVAGTLDLSPPPAA